MQVTEWHSSDLEASIFPLLNLIRIILYSDNLLDIQVFDIWIDEISTSLLLS